MKTKLIGLFLAVFLVSCSRFLDETPQGVVFSDELNTPENIDKMVIAAYSALGNDTYTVPYTSLWPYGDLRSGDSYKGGDGQGDNAEFNQYETFAINTPSNAESDELWYYLYIGVGRANDALRRIDQIDANIYPQKTVRQAEMRFIRGHFYFLLKILFKYVPYIDETVPKEDYDTISNRAYSNDALWTKIADDFRFAVNNLPESQSDVGRPNKYTAEAYLAKTLLYQAYVQDESNQVTSIDQAKLTEVDSLCSDVIKSQKYSLEPDYADNFLTKYENGPESVFAIQYSLDDGTPLGRLDMGHATNYPMNQEYGCCGFHVPSDNLVNAYKTDGNGLPLFSSFNEQDVVSDGKWSSFSWDPRLDHTAAIPGDPYKYDPDFIYQTTWARAPQVYGGLLCLKEVVLPTDPSFKKIPPFMSSSKNWPIIRYADVLLWKAEALIEMGRQDEALPLINQVRERASISTSLLKRADGSSIHSYKMGLYQPGVNCTWTQNFARQALRWERRLEFAMEGYRFFDLVRWGIADTYINDYLSVEQGRKPYLKSARFTKGRDEYLPIPLNQINYSKGLYQQNNGW